MIYNSYLVCYLPFSEEFLAASTKDTYVQIGNNTFYTSSYNTFESFDFKLNKRGGEGGTIKFVKMFGNYKINDKVTLVVEGKQVFNGLVEKVTDYGLTVHVIPMWGLLDFTFIVDTLELAPKDAERETKTVYDTVMGLRKRIRESGVKFNEINVDIPKDISVATTLAGRSLRDILDELEKALPNNYVYGVDHYGEFYFKSFPETREKILNWHAGHFSKSEAEEDYSELFSQYVVKVKDNDTDSYNVLKYIVGDSEEYPAVSYLTNLIGKKTKVFEYGFMSDPNEALNYAYDNLRKQVPVEKLKLSNLNKKVVEVLPNEAIETILKPINNFYEDFELSYSKIPVSSNWSSSGILQHIGYEVGYAKPANENLGVLDFIKQPNYLDCCNRTLDIYEIIVYYISDNATDKFTLRDVKGKTLMLYGKGGILKTSIEGFAKRSLILTSESKSLLFTKMRAYFTQGSRKILMNVREVDYKYSKGLLTVDASLAKINAALTGYFFNKEYKLKKLETLLTNESK